MHRTDMDQKKEYTEQHPCQQGFLQAPRLLRKEPSGTNSKNTQQEKVAGTRGAALP